ncbi:hypothetical protein SUSAZ_09250 [Sulfolobus acidocaldarius SUSAZ]|nr:hypothetical protein SUSAZ_09250 [Sulfolobus acidocaldarius SUSAZ]
MIPKGFTLIKGERPYWYGRISWKSTWPYMFMGALVLLFGLGVINLFGLAGWVEGLIFILIGLYIIFGVPYLVVKSSDYLVTSHRIYVKYGIGSRHSYEIRNEWITDASVNQGILGRLLNYGSITFSTPGHGGNVMIPQAREGTLAIWNISDPFRVKAIIDDAIRKYIDIEKIQEALRDLEKEYNYGRITKEKYEELKRKYENELEKL